MQWERHNLDLEDLSKEKAFKQRCKRGARFSQVKIVGRDFQAEGRAAQRP